MADAKRCDRCGQYYQRVNEQLWYVRRTGRIICDRHGEFDLCDRCLEELTKFMNGEMTDQVIKFVDL